MWLHAFIERKIIVTTTELNVLNLKMSLMSFMVTEYADIRMFLNVLVHCMVYRHKNM